MVLDRGDVIGGARRVRRFWVSYLVRGDTKGTTIVNGDDEKGFRYPPRRSRWPT